MKMYLMISMIVLITFGCATNSKSFKVSTVKNGEGIFYGNVRFIMDGEDVTSTCYFQTKDLEGNRVHYSLDKSGFFVGKANKGKNYLKFISCRDGMMTINHGIDHKNIYFINQGNGTKTYFGDITVYWATGDYSLGLMLLSPAIAGALGPDVKSLAFVVENNRSTEVEFSKKFELKKKIKNVTNLITAPDGQIISKEEGRKILEKMKK